MTLQELATRLEPIANAACASSDPVVLQVATILAAVMGCIADPRRSIDHEALDPLTHTAGLICEHRIGKHQP
jgi:hypothetical protein